MQISSKKRNEIFREKEPKWKLDENENLYRYGKKMPESFFDDIPLDIVKDYIEDSSDLDDFVPASKLNIDEDGYPCEENRTLSEKDKSEMIPLISIVNKHDYATIKKELNKIYKEINDTKKKNGDTSIFKKT